MKHLNSSIPFSRDYAIMVEDYVNFNSIKKNPLKLIGSVYR